MPSDLTVRLMPGLGEYSANRAKVLDVVTHNPGLTAYGVSLYLDPLPAAPGELFRRCFPMTGVLRLLSDLTGAGELYEVPNRRGRQWYPAEGGS